VLAVVDGAVGVLEESPTRDAEEATRFRVIGFEELIWQSHLFAS
jgi:hypothetical protein